jgi:hypothetical protein
MLGCGAQRVRTVDVLAGEAVDFTITAAESKALAGTRLEVPAGGIAADAALTLDQGTSLVPQADNAGPVAVFGPSGLHFQMAGRLTMPFVLPAGRALNQLGVRVQEGDGTAHRLSSNLVTVDADAGLVRLTLQGFTSFQPSTQGCVVDTDCGSGELCASGECVSACTPVDPTCVRLSSDAGCAPTAQAEREQLNALVCGASGFGVLESGACGDAFVSRKSTNPDPGLECFYRHEVLVGFVLASDEGVRAVSGDHRLDCDVLWLDKCLPDAGR